MQLRFELGDPQTPRGHAILYARALGGAERILATYCVVLPIEFSLGKYLPPMFAGTMPLDAMGEGGSAGAVPIPPMLEDAESLDALRQLADLRGDDLCDLGALSIGEDNHRLLFAAEACQEYAELYARYRQGWPAVAAPAPSASVSGGGAATASGAPAGSAPSLSEMDVEDVVVSALPPRQRLGEIARLIGQVRYAEEVRDKRLLGEATDELRRYTRTLPEVYRAEQLVEAVLRSDATGARLAELYLQRAYRLLDEDYIGIPPIEQEIRALREGNGPAPEGATGDAGAM